MKPLPILLAAMLASACTAMTPPPCGDSVRATWAAQLAPAGSPSADRLNAQTALAVHAALLKSFTQPEHTTQALILETAK